MKVQDILTDESRWAKNAFARVSKNGSSVPMGKASAERHSFCLTGAILMARYYAAKTDTTLDYQDALINVRVKIHELFGIKTCIEDWNDNFATFAQVRQVIEALNL